MEAAGLQFTGRDEKNERISPDSSTVDLDLKRSVETREVRKELLNERRSGKETDAACCGILCKFTKNKFVSAQTKIAFNGSTMS